MNLFNLSLNAIRVCEILRETFPNYIRRYFDKFNFLVSKKRSVEN